MIAQELAHDEPLSPELVLVLPPELRAQALARLGPPVWPAPRPRTAEAAAPARQPAASSPIREPLARSIATLVLARAVQLGVIFIFVTILILTMSLVAQAFR